MVARDATTRVTVTVDLNPATFWRKHVLVNLRRPSLRREMVDSLDALPVAAATLPPSP